MPSLVTDILERERARSERPVQVDWCLTRLRSAASGMGALEFEHEIADAARELRRAQAEGAQRESLTLLAMLVMMVRHTLEQRGELELGPVNGEVVLALLRSTEELEWLHERDESGEERPRLFAVRLDEAQAADAEHASETEDPRVGEYWRALDEVFLHNNEVGEEDLPAWPDDLDPTTLRPGMALSFLCAAHAWALAVLLRAFPSSERGPAHMELGYLTPLAGALDMLRLLDDAHCRYVRGRSEVDERNENSLDEGLDALARERRILESVVAAFCRTLYGMERIDHFPPPWLDGPAGVAQGPGLVRTDEIDVPLLRSATDVTRSFARRDLSGAIEALAQCCEAASEVLRVVQPRYRNVLVHVLRWRATDLAWGTNRIRRCTPPAIALAWITRFLRHQDDVEDNSRWYPFAWSSSGFRLMVEDHIHAIIRAADLENEPGMGVSPEHGLVTGIPPGRTRGLSLSRARALLARYDGALSPEERDGDWGEGEGERIRAALEHLARARESLAQMIDVLIDLESAELLAFTDGHMTWRGIVTDVRRRDPPPGPEGRVTGGDAPDIRLSDGMGTLHDVYPRFIDRALDIIEEGGSDIRVLGSSRAGEMVLEINGRVVTVHDNLDYYSCSCEDAHYRSREDRHLCKHMVAAAIILGDFTLREDRHVQRAEGLSGALSEIRERVLAHQIGEAGHVRRIARLQLEEARPREHERHVEELLERRQALRARIDSFQREHIETPLHQRHRRRELRQEMDMLNHELASVEEELHHTPTAPLRRPDIALERRLAEIRGRRQLRVHEEEVVHLRQRRHELAAEREHHAREMDMLRAQLEHLNTDRDDERPQELMNRISRHRLHYRRLTQESEDLARRLDDLLGRIPGRVTIAQAPPGLWECAPPGEGG